MSPRYDNKSSNDLSFSNTMLLWSLKEGFWKKKKKKNTIKILNQINNF